jgi:hypothetical protein
VATLESTLIEPDQEQTEFLHLIKQKKCSNVKQLFLAVQQRHNCCFFTKRTFLRRQACCKERRRYLSFFSESMCTGPTKNKVSFCFLKNKKRKSTKVCKAVEIHRKTGVRLFKILEFPTTVSAYLVDSTRNQLSQYWSIVQPNQR